jgi:hypothetical protein
MRTLTFSSTLLLVAAAFGCSFDLNRQWDMPERFDAPCPPTADWHTAALFTFEGVGTTLVNEVPGGVEGELIGTQGQRVAGPKASCGGERAADE